MCEGPGQSGHRNQSKGSAIGQGLPNLSMFQNHPSSHSYGLGGAQALPFSHTFRYDAGAASSGGNPQADGVTMKPAAPLLPDSGCRAGGLAGKEHHGHCGLHPGMQRGTPLVSSCASFMDAVAANKANGSLSPK